jgi:hypothetical protein
MYTLNVPPYGKYWPEDGLVKLKHVAQTMYYWLYTDVLRLNKPLLKYSVLPFWVMYKLSPGHKPPCNTSLEVNT